jgi:hypothetical protein
MIMSDAWSYSGQDGLGVPGRWFHAGLVEYARDMG